MNFWLLAIILNTVICLMLCLVCVRLDKKCWDLLCIIKGMSKHITDLEEKVGLVHSDIQE